MPKQPASQPQSVFVSIVSFEDEAFLPACIESVRRQTVPVDIRVWDNASRDRSLEIARSLRVEAETSPRNLGFAEAHNRNLRHAGAAEYVLVLNPDVILQPVYLHHLLEAMEELPRCGMAGGKLLRMDAQGRQILSRGHSLIDSTGIYFTRSQRHFDRGSGEEDRDQYPRRQLVFGITGAALLLRRSMLDDLGFGGEVFDPDFFAYREDADLAWRAQLRGWQAVYEPRAVAWHYRVVLPGRRRRLSRLINYHSVKNRYLMRVKNMDPWVRRRCFPYAYLRDIGILLYLLLLEWSSLPALREVWRLRARFLDKRQIVQSQRRTLGPEMAAWFDFEPQAREIENTSRGRPSAA